MKRSVGITGSSGRIGRALAQHLATHGTDVVGIDAQPGAFTRHVADLAVDELTPLLVGCRTIVHCAALHAPHVGVASASEFVDVNVNATARLVAAAKRSGVERLVFTSSTSVYGHALHDPERAVWVDEDLRPLPRDIYDETKLEAERIVASAHSDSFSTISLRVARCFPEDWRTMVVNRLFRSVDIRDVVSGLMAALEARPEEHRVLNLAGPRVFDHSDAEPLRRDAASVLRDRFPSLAAEFATRRWPLPTTIDRVYVSDQIGSALGWFPEHGVQSALLTVPGTA